MHQVKLVDYFFLLHLPGLNQAQTYVLACLRTSLLRWSWSNILFEGLFADHLLCWSWSNIVWGPLWWSGCPSVQRSHKSSPITARSRLTDPHLILDFIASFLNPPTQIFIRLFVDYFLKTFLLKKIWMGFGCREWIGVIWFIYLTAKISFKILAPLIRLANIGLQLRY